ASISLPNETPTAPNLDKRRISELSRRCFSASDGLTRFLALPLRVHALSMKRTDVVGVQKRQQQGAVPNLQLRNPIKQEVRIPRWHVARLCRNPTMNTR